MRSLGNWSNQHLWINLKNFFLQPFQEQDPNCNRRSRLYQQLKSLEVSMQWCNPLLVGRRTPSLLPRWRLEMSIWTWRLRCSRLDHFALLLWTMARCYPSRSWCFQLLLEELNYFKVAHMKLDLDIELLWRFGRCWSIQRTRLPVLMKNHKELMWQM